MVAIECGVFEGFHVINGISNEDTVVIDAFVESLNEGCDVDSSGSGGPDSLEGIEQPSFEKKNLFATLETENISRVGQKKI